MGSVYFEPVTVFHVLLLDKAFIHGLERSNQFVGLISL